MAIPTPDQIGWAPEQLLNGYETYGGEQSYATDSMTPEQIKQWQMQYWLPQIATGGYIPPEYDSPEAMAALGQTDAYNQRMQYLNQVGAQRLATLQDHQADSRNGGIAAQTYALAGMGLGTIGALAGGGAGAAAAGSGASGAATTYPYAAGNYAGGAITGSAIPGVAAPAAAAGGSGVAANALGGAAGGSFLENWLPTITGGVNTLLGAHTANQAMDAESQALQAAIEEQKRQYDTTRADFQPWMDAGRDALTQMGDPGKYFAESPDYAFRRDEGTRGIENSFAARGAGQSGNALRALAEFNSGLASGEFGNWFDRQSTRAGLGTSGTGAVANAGANAARNSSNFMADQGASRASGVFNRNSTISQGITNASDDVYNWLYNRRRRAA